MKQSHRTSSIVAQILARLQLLALLAVATTAAACGGGNQGADPVTPAGDGSGAKDATADQEKAAALQRMRARQAEVCEDFCVRANDCAREDAMANSPEVLVTKDGVTGDQLLAAHKAQCLNDCNNSGIMTPAQRAALVQCFPEEQCSAFAECAGQALSKPKK